MTIRTAFWHDRIIPRYKIALRRLINRSPQYFFHTGNAGDIFTKSIIRNEYNQAASNVVGEGNRLLLVGSIVHRVEPGDILCGTGVKTADVPKANKAPCLIQGLRGPISYDILAKAGHDVSTVRFLLDPGLLIRFYAKNLCVKPASGAIFIPHYRERNLYYSGLPKGIRFVDIDDQPLSIARQILESELVYASSLHGIIFAHALNRPAVLVLPQTEEPLLKYEDYFASVNLDMLRPLNNIDAIDFKKSPTSPPDIKYKHSDFVLPEISTLQEKGILVE